MKTFLLAATVFAASLGLAQTPTLRDTIAYMNVILQTEDGGFVYASGYSENGIPECSIDVTQNNRIKSLLPVGVKDDHFKYAVIGAPFMFTRVPLSEIDPYAIKSSGAFSPEYISKTHPDDNPKALDDPDLALVIFSAKDKKKVIELTNTLSDGTTGSPAFDKEKASGGWFLFRSKEGADKFVMALKRAIELCTGPRQKKPPPMPSTADF
jgi:hypothetical protein